MSKEAIPPLTFEPISYRDWSVAYCELAHNMWTNAFEKEFNWRVSDICYEWDGKKVTIFRPKEEHTAGMFRFIRSLIASSSNAIANLATEVEQAVYELERFIQASKEKIRVLDKSAALRMLEQLIEFQNIIGPKFFIIMYLPQHLEAFPEYVTIYPKEQKIALEARSRIDRLFAPLSNSFIIDLGEYMVSQLGMRLGLGRFLTVNELRDYYSNSNIYVQELENLLTQREQHFLVAAGTVRTETIEEYLHRNGWALLIPDENVESRLIRGTSPARLGIVTGRVKVVEGPSEMHKIIQGDIIVAPMTTPEYGPIFKKVKAIITNEGGITSHAAIVAREMHLPAVIGTKVATKILKDGDLVEVDTNAGIVKIIT